jgi:hypothetical protein
MNTPGSGINILTNSQAVIVDGAEEFIKDYHEGRLTADELYAKILDAEVVYVDRSASSQFKDTKDIGESK